MWQTNWRAPIWQNLEQLWDILIIGGGITGAGLFNEAVRAGYKVLLVEAQDFSFGTSSRSSKLVHGGLRYLRNGQFDVTYESVREREAMLREAPHLVTPLRFLYPGYQGVKTANWKLGLGITIYDLMAPKWAHSHYSARKLLSICPQLNPKGLTEGYGYFDAQVDDSRLVIRILREGVRRGGTALNYTRAIKLLKRENGEVCGAVLEDTSGITQQTAEVQARVVINATGPWTDDLRREVASGTRIRKLRGSHILFPWEKLPIQQAVTLLHPRDDRALFAIPWEGTTMIGTTDLDHHEQEGETEPRISEQELDYLLEATRYAFPAYSLGEDDLLSTFAGLRPIVQSGDEAPSKASRAHVIWHENGLVTITGGKLTIFRVMAAQTLNSLRSRLSGSPNFDHRDPAFDPLPDAPAECPFDRQTFQYLAGRYGNDAVKMVCESSPAELTLIGETPNFWAELRHAARDEGVIHLDDLLLRRVRLGLNAPQGGSVWMEDIRKIVQPELSWDDARWTAEVERYTKIWKCYYYLP